MSILSNLRAEPLRRARAGYVAPSTVVRLILALLAATPATLRAQLPSDAQLASRVDEYMSRLASLGYTGGVLVVRGGKPVITRSYGMADRARGIKADTNTVYSLGSITKQFTAAAILRLEELGKLRTTDSIARFFPNAPADKRGITLHQLLTHTAGFKSDYSPTDYEATTRAEYMQRIFDAPLRSKPGTTFSYANAGYSMLAAIVEIATGQEYEAALRELVLNRAGMLQTGYKLPAWAPARIAHGYQNGTDWGTISERIAMAGAPYWELRGNGGLQTTLGDMQRWDAALTDNRMLTDSSRRKFMTGYVNEGPAGLSQYAYGWSIMKSQRGTRVIAHNGGNGVYVAELLRFVDDHVTLFVTSTVSEMTATSTLPVLSRIAFGQPYDLPPARVAGSETATAAAAGTYTFQDKSRLILRAVDGKLMAEAVGQQALQLVATGDTASPPSATSLNARSAAIVKSLVSGDIAPLRAALGPGGMDSAEVATQERQLMASRRERFGEYQSLEVLGTTASPEGGLRTTVRLNFARGAVTNLYTWNREGVIMDLGARPYAPTELLPAEQGEFRVFDARGGAASRLAFTRDGLRVTSAKGVISVPRTVDR
jgi:CubicO group peptidase (beta-lactamase class C family)